MKTHRQYVKEQIERDPGFAKLLADATSDVRLSLALAELRERRAISQRELARLTGMKQPQIARLESGGQLPNLNTLWRILDVLRAKVELGPRRSAALSPLGKSGRMTTSR